MRNKGILIRKMSGAVLCILLLAPATLMAQEKMPITTSSEEARELFIEGRAQFEKFNLTKSSNLLHQAIEIDPEFAMAHLYLSVSEGGGTSFALKTLNKAIKFSSKVSEGERQLIHLSRAMQSGNETAGESHTNALLKLHPEDERTQLWIGYYRFNQGKYMDALSHFKRAEKLNKAFHPVYNVSGYAYMILKKPVKAEQYFRKYLEILPDAANPHDSYAEFLMNQKRFDESVKHYKKALQLNPNFVSIHKHLGDICLFRDDKKSARQHYRNLYLNAPNHKLKFSAILLEASVDLCNNNPDAALRVIDRYSLLAEELDLPYHKFYSCAYKGHILSENISTEKALNQYRKAGEIAKNSDLTEKVRNNLLILAHLWELNALAKNYNTVKEAETARKRCEALISDQKNPMYRENYHRACGIMEMKKGHFERARNHFAKAGENPLTWYYIGQAWHQEGDHYKAHEWYRKVAGCCNNSLNLGNVKYKAFMGLQEKL
jgi:tetratricopeptide (TPR) repeat protein